jgi:hypothetical protein
VRHGNTAFAPKGASIALQGFFYRFMPGISLQIARKLQGFTPVTT